jgi:Superinfection immunity protein
MYLTMILMTYFIPTGIALARGHHQKWAILAVNLLLGWTVLGWFVALAWALTQVRGYYRALHPKLNF